jgi:hypothetical protein
MRAGNVASVMGDALLGRVVFSMANVAGAWCLPGQSTVAAGVGILSATLAATESYAEPVLA